MSKSLSQKEIVRLREKPLKNGGSSLYLDIYLNGERRYEFLKLYLVNAKNANEKESNKQTLMIAKAVQAKRTLQIQNGRFGFNSPLTNITLIDFFMQLMSEKERTVSEATKKSWESVLYHLKQFIKGRNYQLKAVDESFLDRFVCYLQGLGLSENTMKIYNDKLRCSIREAIKRGYLERNVLESSINIKKEETERTYLTAEEVRLLVDTPCKKDILKTAFLFSCLTGLRKSDIQSLTWGNIQEVSGYARIVFRQRKTKGQMYLDISRQALSLLGERKANEIKVFPGFKVKTEDLYDLRCWCLKAGIKKDGIVFHSARHTFAVMALANGVDLYTVSKMLGHRNIGTTQIYAKILDQSIRQAVDKLPDILGDKKEESGK